jgi:hypothetical protein
MKELMHNLGILTLHGIGEQDEQYADEFLKHLKSLLPADIRSKALLRPIYYQDIMKGNQENNWAKYENTTLRARLLRKKLLYYGGDAVSYRYRSDQADSIYVAVHERINQGIVTLCKEANNPQTHLIIVAQSFGGQAMSNHIWDAQRGIGLYKNNQPTDSSELSNIHLLITTGCNIPLFVSGVPAPQAIQPLHDSFQWYNLYDKNDILGWPLRPLSDSYSSVVTADMAVNTGFWLGSHGKYWERRKVVKLIAGLITSSWQFS